MSIEGVLSDGEGFCRRLGFLHMNAAVFMNLVVWNDSVLSLLFGKRKES
jgi:hypothetical protein